VAAPALGAHCTSWGEETRSGSGTSSTGTIRLSTMLFVPLLFSADTRHQSHGHSTGVIIGPQHARRAAEQGRLVAGPGGGSDPARSSSRCPLPADQSPLCLCACGNFPGGCSFEETNTASRIEFLGRIWHHERCLLTLVLVYIAHRMGSV
jgi:hypothetical protein